MPREWPECLSSPAGMHVQNRSTSTSEATFSLISQAKYSFLRYPTGHFKASKSGCRLIYCSSETSCDGFWSSKIVWNGRSGSYQTNRGELSRTQVIPILANQIFHPLNSNMHKFVFTIISGSGDFVSKMFRSLFRRILTASPSPSFSSARKQDTMWAAAHNNPEAADPEAAYVDPPPPSPMSYLSHFFSLPSFAFMLR